MRIFKKKRKKVLTEEDIKYIEEKLYIEATKFEMDKETFTDKHLLYFYHLPFNTKTNNENFHAIYKEIENYKYNTNYDFYTDIMAKKLYNQYVNFTTILMSIAIFLLTIFSVFYEKKDNEILTTSIIFIMTLLLDKIITTTFEYLNSSYKGDLKDHYKNGIKMLSSWSILFLNVYNISLKLVILNKIGYLIYSILGILILLNLDKIFKFFYSIIKNR